MASIESITSQVFGLALIEAPFPMLSSRGRAGRAYTALDQGTDATDIGPIVVRIGVSSALGNLRSAWVWSSGFKKKKKGGRAQTWRLLTILPGRGQRMVSLVLREHLIVDLCTLGHLFSGQCSLLSDEHCEMILSRR